MTRDEAVADFAGHADRNGGTSMFTEEEWVAWRLRPMGYRGKKESMSLGHEHNLRGTMVPGYEPGPGMDRGLFWNGSNW